MSAKYTADGCRGYGIVCFGCDRSISPLGEQPLYSDLKYNVSGRHRADVLVFRESSGVYSYACKDYPGMETCPGYFFAETEDEVCKLVELHALVAHNEDPSEDGDADWKYLKTLIRSE